ncbi:hypothetical protein NP233_g317 [Leucocoprinus birnbaumii]|uniref:NACHT domain-containing protein n=1 Tax=Leucocoprinus birnbaumii TaxID=56174 RepID=A0AAD5W6Y7_9AGAR|nr:hypothetical protein NP233_g317 [Leucocoprinus birnbaumii]
MHIPISSERVADNHSTYTNEQERSGVNTHILPYQFHTQSEYISSTHPHDQHNTLTLPPLECNPPSRSGSIQNYNIQNWNSLSSLTVKLPGHPLTQISDPPSASQLTSSVNVPSNNEVYHAEMDRNNITLPSIKNLLNPASASLLSHSEQLPRSVTPLSAHRSVHAQYSGHHTEDQEPGLRFRADANDAIQLAPIPQLLAPEGSPAHSSRPSSRSNIPGRRQSRRLSPLSPRQTNNDAGGYSMGRYPGDRRKGRADYSDDIYSRAYTVAQPQSSILQPQSASVEDECAQSSQQHATIQAGCSGVLHLQPSLSPPTTTSGSVGSHDIAARTPEMTSSSQISLFSGSHSFAMHHPTFVVNPPGTVAQQSEHSAAMNWLKASMIEHAQHDSAGRDPPPRCHPDTRISILDRTHNWINNPQRQKHLLWIRGPAGVGKSAIVQTLADALSRSGRLMASLFFSRPNGRSNPQRVFPTIAYQLASQDAAYRTYIETIRPPGSQPLETKAMNEQFRLLVVDPFVKHKLFTRSGDVLIAIDGLDECDGDPGADDYDQTCHHRRTLKEVHREIIELVSSFVKAHPSIPVIWVIASRPESHITAVFGSSDVKGSYVEESILVDDEEACADVERFLNTSFKKIAEAYPDHITETPWPAYHHFLQIAKAASGLFIFAEVVIRFINDPREENPISQLGHVLAAIAKLRQSRKNKNPLSALDIIYTAILSRIPPTRMENLKKLLPLVIYVHRSSITVRDYKFRNMYEHFDISREDAITSFNYLHSVIYFPRVKDIGGTHPRFYHASFRDYLEDSSRSGDYTVETWNASLTWPLSAAIFDNTDWSILSKSIPWLHKLFERLSPSGSVAKVLIHRYEISDGQLQDILDRLDFWSLLSQNIGNRSFRNLHQEATKKISCADELKRRGILRQATLASLGTPLFHNTWFGKMDKMDSYTVINYGRPGLPGYVTNEYATQMRAGFHRLLMEEPETKLSIWGSQKEKQCAIISAEDLPDWWCSLNDRINREDQTVYITRF